jgi:hypothetical protein
MVVEERRRSGRRGVLMLFVVARSSAKWENVAKTWPAAKV